MLAANDFISLAKALLVSKPGETDGPAREQWNRDIQAVANACALLNPRFNKQVWLAYIESGSLRLVETQRRFAEGHRWK